MIRFPAAKINLGLAVTERRTDGYHNIESVFYPIPIFDALEAIPSQKHGCNLTIAGLHIPGSLDNNLVIRAWEILHRDYNIGGVEAALLKRIPMGAGLGGGSSNGAHMLLLLNDLFELSLSIEQLEVHAAELGSDCPFFIRQRPTFVSGRGEQLEAIDLDLSGWWLLLVHPGIHVGTKEAYGLVSPYRADARPIDIVRQHPSHWQGRLINDFQVPVSKKHPEILKALDALNQAGAVYTAMSGSGSAVFGLFSEETSIANAPKHWSISGCELKS